MFTFSTNVHKFIAYHRNLMLQDQALGATAAITSILEAKAKKVLKNYSKSDQKRVFDFLDECVKILRNTETFQILCESINLDPLVVCKNEVLLYAVMMQLELSEEISQEDINFYIENKSIIKVLVNMKYLPEEFLSESDFVLTA